MLGRGAAEAEAERGARRKKKRGDLGVGFRRFPPRRRRRRSTLPCPPLSSSFSSERDYQQQQQQLRRRWRPPRRRRSRASERSLAWQRRPRQRRGLRGHPSKSSPREKESSTSSREGPVPVCFSWRKRIKRRGEFLGFFFEISFSLSKENEKESGKNNSPPRRQIQ